MSKLDKLLKENFDNSNSGCAIISRKDKALIIEYYNPAFKKMLSLRKDISGMDAEEAFAGKEEILEFLSNREDNRPINIKGKTYNVSKRINGQTVNLRICGEQLCREQAEYNLSVKDAIFTDSLQAMLIVGKNGEVLEINKTARDSMQVFLGLNADKGTNLLKLLDRKNRENAKDIFGRVFAGQTIRDEWSVEKHGIIYYAQFDAAPLTRGKQIYAVCIIAIDVTSTKHTAEKIKEEEKKFESLVSFSSDIITILGRDGTMLYGSPSARRVLGYDVEKDLMGKSVFDFLHPEDVQAVAKVFMEGMETPDTIVPAPEFRFRHKDGTWVPIEAVGVNKLDDPSINGMIVNSRDLSERKIAEREKENRLRFLQTLINTTPQPIFYMNKEGKYEGCNRYFEEYLGFREEDIIGKTVFDVSPKELADIYKERDGDILKNGGEQEFQSDVVFADGTVHEVIAHKAAFYDGNGEIAGLVGVLSDITEIKAMQRRLQDEKDRLAVTLKSIGEGVIATDANGKIILMNSVAEEMTGILESKAFMSDVKTVLKLTEVNSGEEIVPDINAPGSEEYECVLQDANQAEYYVIINISPIQNKERERIGTVVVFRNITEKIKMEEELMKTEKLESLGVLAGGIAHDFNNILTIIIGNLSLAKRFIEDKRKVSEFLEGVERGTLRAKTLTQQLLTFSKGGAPLKKKESMKALIMDSVEFAMSGSKLRSRFEIDEELWSADVDAGQINQVINNLVINAEQAMPKGGTIFVGACNMDGISENNIEKRGKYIKISISDEGIGIPDEYIGKVFDPFFTTKQSGSGLGLSTAYSIIKKHDGHITVHSKPGKGTHFAFYIPAIGTGRIMSAQSEESEYIGKGRVLMMDDDRELKEVAKDMFNVLGVDVVFASEGEETIEIYRKNMKENPFDLVILDLTIPGGMGGKDTIEDLLKIDPGITAIVSSGYSNDRVLSHYSEYGFKGILQKPYQIDELNAILLKLIDGAGG